MSTATCQRCGHPLEPGASFCGQCGAPVAPASATRVAVPAAATSAAATSAASAGPPFAVFRGAGPVPWQRAIGPRTRAWGLMIGLAFVAIVAAGLIGWGIGQRLAPSCSGPDCGPLSAPLAATQPYKSSRYGFSLDATGYCRSIAMPVTGHDDASIDWTLKFPAASVGDWPVNIHGEPADGREAQPIVESLKDAKYADAQFVYSIPMADIGYAPGYGAVYDLLLSAGSAQPTHTRVILIAAVKGDLAIVLDSIGPFDAQKLGHPFPAQTHGVICFSPMINTIAWPGEPPP